MFTITGMMQNKLTVHRLNLNIASDTNLSFRFNDFSVYQISSKYHWMSRTDNTTLNTILFQCIIPGYCLYKILLSSWFDIFLVQSSPYNTMIGLIPFASHNNLTWAIPAQSSHHIVCKHDLFSCTEL